MKKIAVTGLVLILIFNVVTIFPAFGFPEPRIYVDPPESKFTSDVTPVGYEFNVTVKVEGIVDPGVYAHEFKLYYDPTLLNATAAILPPDDFMSPAPAGRVVPPPLFGDDYVYAGVSLQGVVDGKTGDGTLYIITLQIISAPPPLGVLSCDLELSGVDFLNPDLDSISVTTEDGYYECSAPGSPIFLKVTPENSTAREVGDQVSIGVTINELVADLKLVGVEFKIRYNTTLLETKEDWITEGNFIKSFGTTLFTVNVTDDYILVNITLQTETGPFPEGSGTIATIKFNVTYVPPTLTTSDLTLYDITLVDVEGNVIPPHHLEQGRYKVPVTIRPEDINEDGKISIYDIAAWALSFGSYAGHPRWDPRCDINGDGRVNIIDAIRICQKFGT